METEFTNRVESAMKITEELVKETQEKGKVSNYESKENLGPGILASDEEVPINKLHDQPRKSVPFVPGIA